MEIIELYVKYFFAYCLQSLVFYEYPWTELYIQTEMLPLRLRIFLLVTNSLLIA